MIGSSNPNRETPEEQSRRVPPSRPRPNRAPDPSPQDIEEACFEIQSNWSEDERRARLIDASGAIELARRLGYWEPPVYEDREG